MKEQIISKTFNNFQLEEDDEFQEISQLPENTVNPFSSISSAWQNLNIACHKSVQTISKLATNIAYNAKHSNCPLIQRKQILLLHNSSPVFLLGNSYDYQHQHDFIWTFRNIIWLSYRSNEETNSSDAGWGCMIRVCQMLLAETLKKSEYKLQLSQIIQEFTSENEGMFCLDQICQEGKIMNRWTSSTQILLAMKNILSTQNKYKLDIQIFNGVVSLDDYKNLNYPLLVVVSNRLGQRQIPQTFFQHILKLIEHKYFIGMIGGVGGQAVYIVGHHEENVILLDPHYVQSQKNGEGVYFKKTPRGICLKKLASSVAFCYYFTSKQQHMQWLQDVAESCYACRPNSAIQMTKEQVQKINIKKYNRIQADSDDQFQVLS